MAVDVLVTGGSGVLGTQIVNRLRKSNYNVVVCGRSADKSMDTTWDISKQDSPKLTCEPQAVIHAAAQVGYYGQPFSDAISLFNVNIVGTLRVANWCVSQKVKKLILVSGAIVYGEWAGLPKSESDLVNPHIAGAYAISKWCSEKISCIVTHAGCDLSIFRFSSLYGKGYKNGLAQRLLRKGIVEGDIHLEPPYGDAFDLLHVSDAAYTIQRSMESKLTGLWNVGGEKLTTIQELVEICASQVNAQIVFSSDKSSRQPRIINWVDDRKARNEIGHKNLISLEMGIAKIKDNEGLKYE